MMLFPITARLIFCLQHTAITPGYGAGVQLEFFVVVTTKKADGTEVAHEPIVIRHPDFL